MVLKQVKPDDPYVDIEFRVTARCHTTKNNLLTHLIFRSRTGVTIEAWSQGWMVGALIIMACITVVNMRRKILLHKLILLEVRPMAAFEHAIVLT